MKKYIAKPEFIGTLDVKGLYDAERIIHDTIDTAVNLRVKQLKEDYWTEALPQTLKMILDSWDKPASEVAAKAYLSRKEEVIEIA